VKCIDCEYHSYEEGFYFCDAGPRPALIEEEKIVFMEAPCEIFEKRTRKEKGEKDAQRE